MECSQTHEKSGKELRPGRRLNLIAVVTIEAAFAAALQQQRNGQLAEAETSYRAILATSAGQPEVFYNLGIVLRDLGRWPESVSAYERALDLRPRFPEAVNNLGAALERLGRLDEAEDIFRHALLLEPESADAWNNLGGVLKDLGRLDESIECLTRAHELKPDDARIHSNLVFTLHYSPRYNSRALLDAASGWNRRHAASLDRPTKSHPNDPSPHRKLRIGYLSGNFREHCQAFFTLPLLSHHDHDRFEIVGYSDALHCDEITTRLKNCTDAWRPIHALDDVAVAALIRRDQIDLLVDLTLHMAGHRLPVFALKPAPVQVTWLGYPGTTGLATMDYRLTDPQLDPAGSDEFYTEKSVRLPDSFWCYDPLADQPAVNDLPVKQAGYFTFGCLNNFCKVTEATLDCWAEILRRVPRSKLIVLTPPGASRVRVKSRLGLTAERVEFVAYQPRADYLKLYHRIDLCLDTFPYNGHTTSLDALWMGVPVISLSGFTAVSRAGLSLMKNLNLSELVAENPAQFIQLAVQLAGDRARLTGLRTGLRERMQQSPLMDAPRLTRHIEDAYRAMWAKWMEDQSMSRG